VRSVVETPADCVLTMLLLRTGRIHAVQMRFGNTYMALSITVVPNNDMEFLFGLDNLRRLRGVIDLNRNMLCLDGAGGREEVNFLP
jgi:DNA damage-inducible protein 1